MTTIIDNIGDDVVSAVVAAADNAAPVGSIRNTRIERNIVFSEHFTSLRSMRSPLSCGSERGGDIQ